jgi:hypothetical protein
MTNDELTGLVKYLTRLEGEFGAYGGGVARRVVVGAQRLREALEHVQRYDNCKLCGHANDTHGIRSGIRKPEMPCHGWCDCLGFQPIVDKR